MLTKILNTLNGHGSEAASLEAALLQLGRDRDEARAKIEALQKQRHQALLDDASDADLDKLERQLDRALTRLEKLNLAEPPLLEKLTGARSAARQRRWHTLLEEYHTAAGEFISAARVATQKHNALVGAILQARCEGFEAEASAMMPATPNLNGHALLAPDLLDIFERSIAPRSTPPRRAAPPPAPKAPRPLLPGERPEGSLQHPIPEQNVGALPFTAKRTPDDLSPLEPGQVRVMALTNGWSPAENRPQTHAGQKLVMTAAEARIALDHGKIEIIEKSIDRTAVEGASWESIDARTGITSLGSGGDSVVRLNVAPPAAASDQPNKGV
jgi:hypothetical protein